MRRRLFSLAVVLAVPAAAASGAVPTTQTCRPQSIPLTFMLPADWACQGPPPYGHVTPGARAGGVAPGYVVQLDIYTAKVQATGPVSDYAESLAGTIRRRLAAYGSTLRVTHAATTVGASVPAVVVTVRSGATLLHVDYFVIHGGVLYEFDYGYQGSPRWLSKDLGAIRASAKSIHFVTTA